MAAESVGGLTAGGPHTKLRLGIAALHFAHVNTK